MNKTVYVAGHQGMVGSALLRRLTELDGVSLVTATHSELDLTRQSEVEQFFQDLAIDDVYLAAAKVGGIHANNEYPADFIYQNLMMECNVIHAAWKSSVARLLFLGSSCIYPRLADQPIDEAQLLAGQLEPTNEPYAVAKIAGIKLCESYNRQHGTDYRSVMPTNLYGENDNFHPQNGHVVPAMLARFHDAVVNQAAEVGVWGSGKPKREFLHVDDMADACVHVMNLSPDQYWRAANARMSHINIGTGVDCTIRELAESIAKVVGFEGEITFDTNKPDGTPRKLLNNQRIHALGWRARIDLEQGLGATYQWFLENESSLRGGSV